MGTTPIDIVRANYSRRSEIQAELGDIDDKVTTEKRGYDDTEAGRIEELRSELGAIDQRITANIDAALNERSITDGIEGMFAGMLDRQGDQLVDTRSIGERFVQSDEYRSFLEGGNDRPRTVFDGIELRAVTDVVMGVAGGGSSSTSGGAMTRPERLDRVGHDFLDRRVYLLDLVPHIGTTAGAVEYVQDQTALADSADKAAETAESGVKPQAGLTLAVKTEPMQVIPAWVNLTRQAAADVPQIQGYLDGRLRYALKRRTDLQIISGNGTSPNLSGLSGRSGIVTYAPGGAEARYKSIRHGIRMMEDKEAVPEIIVLNPADAELFDLSNDAANGLHAVPNLVGVPERTAWGLTQVRSTAVASGTALLIDPMALSVFDRQQPTAYMTDSHASNFTANILTLLLECRVGLALFDPNGVCKITFNGTT